MASEGLSPLQIFRTVMRGPDANTHLLDLTMQLCEYVDNNRLPNMSKVLLGLGSHFAEGGEQKSEIAVNAIVHSYPNLKDQADKENALAIWKVAIAHSDTHDAPKFISTTREILKRRDIPASDALLQEANSTWHALPEAVLNAQARIAAEPAVAQSRERMYARQPSQPGVTDIPASEAKRFLKELERWSKTQQGQGGGTALH